MRLITADGGPFELQGAPSSYHLWGRAIDFQVFHWDGIHWNGNGTRDGNDWKSLRDICIMLPGVTYVENPQRDPKTGLFNYGHVHVDNGSH